MTTVGMSRNNPFDIEPNHIAWLGEAARTSPVTFDTVEHGLRAGVLVFLAYARAGLDTPRLAISTFAPPADNPTAQYVADVCAWCGVKPDQRVDFRDASFMVRWSRAVIRQEQGAAEEASISDAALVSAVGAAFAYESIPDGLGVAGAA